MDLSFPSFVSGALGGILTGLAAMAASYFARRQNRLVAATVAADWLRDLRDWASEGIDVITEAVYGCKAEASGIPPTENETLVGCQHRLSSLIDRGRLLLPNERPDEYGVHKSSAYRGYRHPALDALVAAERLMGGSTDLAAFPDRSTALDWVRKEFVSSIQSILDPASTNRTVAKLLAEAHDRYDPSGGGLLPNPAAIPSGEIRRLRLASARYLKDLDKSPKRPPPQPSGPLPSR